MLVTTQFNVATAPPPTVTNPPSVINLPGSCPIMPRLTLLSIGTIPGITVSRGHVRNGAPSGFVVVPRAFYDDLCLRLVPGHPPLCIFITGTLTEETGDLEISGTSFSPAGFGAFPALSAIGADTDAIRRSLMDHSAVVSRGLDQMNQTLTCVLDVLKNAVGAAQVASSVKLPGNGLDAPTKGKQPV